VTLCRWELRGFAITCLVALAIGLVGSFGLFGQEQDPLARVFVIILGQPWVAWISGVAEPLRPWLAAVCPLLHIFLLAALCGALSARRGTSG
jgi:hypothetical protein